MAKKNSIKAVSVAKGYKNDMGETKIAAHVDYDSKTYAFLEIERRDFDARTGKKISKPQIVSFNNQDLLNFVGKMEGKKVVIQSQKEVQGFSINAVFHVPSTFGVKVTADNWDGTADEEADAADNLPEE